MRRAQEGGVHCHVRGKHLASLQPQRHGRPIRNLVWAAEHRLASLQHRQCRSTSWASQGAAHVYKCTSRGLGDRSFSGFSTVREAGDTHIIAVRDQAEFLGAIAAGHEAQQQQWWRLLLCR